MTFPTTDNPKKERFKQSLKWNILIELADHSKYWSTQLQTAASGNNFANTYLDEIDINEGLGTVTQKINTRGGFSTSGDFTFNILNQEFASNFLGDAVYWENDDLEVSIIINDGTDLVYAERIKIFVGIVDNIEFDENVLTFSVTDKSKAEDQIIPRKVITLRDYPLAEAQLIDTPMLAHFGDFDPAAEETSLPGSFSIGALQNLTTCPLNGRIDRADAEYLIGELEANVPPGTLDIYKHISELNHFIRIQNITGGVFGATGTILIDKDAIGQFNAKMDTFHEDDPGDVTDISNMLGDDHTAYTTVGTNPGAAEALYLKYRGFSTPGDLINSQGKTTGDYNDFKLTCITGTKSGSGAVTLGYVPTPGGTLHQMPGGTSVLTASAAHIALFDDSTGVPDFPSEITWENIKNIAFVISAATNTSMQINHLFLTIENIVIYYEPVKTPQPILAPPGDVRDLQEIIPARNIISLSNVTLFARMEGEDYPTWINSRSGGASGLAASQLIEEPVGMIEYIAREYGGLATADINTANSIGGFDLAYTDLSAWTFAGVFTNPTNWKDAINHLAEQCKARVYFNREGKLNITVYNSAANFTQSGTGTPDEDGDGGGTSDVYEKKPTLNSNGRYDNHAIKRRSFHFDYTPKDLIANEVYVNYYFNYALGLYQKTAFITADDSDDGTGTADESGGRETTAGTSQTNYKKTKRITFNAPFIRDNATAVLLRNHIFDLKVEHRAVVKFTTFFSALHLNPGDIINIQHPFLTNVVASVATKKWEVTELGLDIDKFEIHVTAMELV